MQAAEKYGQIVTLQSQMFAAMQAAEKSRGATTVKVLLFAAMQAAEKQNQSAGITQRCVCRHAGG